MYSTVQPLIVSPIISKIILINHVDGMKVEKSTLTNYCTMLSSHYSIYNMCCFIYCNLVYFGLITEQVSHIHEKYITLLFPFPDYRWRLWWGEWWVIWLLLPSLLALASKIIIHLNKCCNIYDSNKGKWISMTIYCRFYNVFF